MSLLLFLTAVAGAAPPPAPPLDLVTDAEDAQSLVPWGLRAEVYGDALHAWRVARDRGEVSSSILTVIDYSLAPADKRLWVVDLSAGRLLFHERVAHGKNSGWARMTSWSNVPESRQSSIGVSRTAETYTGKHGLSLRLDGLEPVFNGNNRPRNIVMHGADYVSADVAAEHGRVGNSWGCPAVGDEVAPSLMRTIADGTLLVVWYPDVDWRRESAYLQK